MHLVVAVLPIQPSFKHQLFLPYLFLFCHSMFLHTLLKYFSSITSSSFFSSVLMHHVFQHRTVSMNISSYNPFFYINISYTYTICQQLQSRGRSVAELQVTGVRANLNKRPHESTAILSVHSLLLVDALQTFGPDFELLVASHKHVR